MRTARSARTFVVTAGLVIGAAALPMAWFLLNEVAAETGANSGLQQPAPGVVQASSLPTMAAPLSSHVLPFLSAPVFSSTDAQSAPDSTAPDSTATDGTATDGTAADSTTLASATLPASSPHPLPRALQLAASSIATLPANSVPANALSAEPPAKPNAIALSINLDSMRLDALADSKAFGPNPIDAALEAASLDTYGLTTEEVSQIVEVKPGDTLIELLVDAGATQEDAYAAVTALEPAFSPRELKPGQAVELTFASAPLPALQEIASFQLVGLAIQPNAERDVQVNRSFDGLFTVMEIAHPLQQITVRGGGVIDSSLFEAGQDAGVSISALTEMIRAFSFDVDFQREIQPGDAFEIVYDQYLDENGGVVKTGGVSYVSLSLSGETLELYQFTPSSGVWDFFNPNGESVRKALMRTPIDGARLTSGFGMRKHPTLGYNKMHRGVDFGAPTGTPIYAAGDGVIEKIGANGGYGNYIRIRHNSEYSTAYAHMNGFAKGLGQGDRVRQGDVIGYVGTTGRSTGPHLHYEVMVAGEQVNPLDIKLPAGEKLAGADLEDFFAARDVIVSLRDTLRRGELMVAGNQPGNCYSVAEEKSC
jgi:murein DD-endopeptidase MepM/ murein hydrolase activator NlpD